MTTPIDKFLQKCANQNARKSKMLRIAVEELEKIRDGGVPDGVLANSEERMLAMCAISSLALMAINKLASEEK